MDYRESKHTKKMIKHFKWFFTGEGSTERANGSLPEPVCPVSLIYTKFYPLICRFWVDCLTNIWVRAVVSMTVIVPNFTAVFPTCWVLLVVGGKKHSDAWRHFSSLESRIFSAALSSKCLICQHILTASLQSDGTFGHQPPLHLHLVYRENHHRTLQLH